MVAACTSGTGDGADVTTTTASIEVTTTPLAPSTTAGGSGDLTLPDEPTPPTRCDRAAARRLGTEPTSADPLTVSVWYAIGLNDPSPVIELFERFDAEHPYLAVELRFLDGFPMALQELRSSDPADFPDLVLLQADNVRLVHDAGLFVAPGECDGDDEPNRTTSRWIDDLVPVVAATYTVDDEVRAYPFSTSTPVMLFDRARVAAAGLDPDRPPTSLDELRAAAAQMIESGAAAQGLVLYDRSASWFLEQAAARDGRVLLEPDNGRNEGRVDAVVFATDESLASLAWIRSMVADGLATWIGANPSGIDDLFAMVDDTSPAAFTLHTSAALGDVIALLGDEQTPYPDAVLGVAPLPFAGQGSLVGGGAFWLVDRGDPLAAGAAAVLGDWLMSAPAQAQFAAATGYVPAVMSAADEPALLARWTTDPALEVGFRQLVEAATTPAAAGMQVGPRIQIQRVLELAAAEAASGDRDLVEIVRDAERDAAELLAEYTPR